MRLRQLGFLAVAFGSVTTMACAAPTSGGRSGSVEVVTRRGAAALSAADVATVAVTVSGDNIPTPMRSDLANDNGTWHGTITDIPVGAARFDGVALDAQDARIYAGSAPNVSITPGATAVVALLLQQANAPAPFANDAPIIDSFTASTNLVAPDQIVHVTGAAHKASGGALTYAWSADGGTFSSPTSASSDWTAPSETGTYNLTFRASDATGLTATITFTLVVQNGNAAVTTSFNTWPTADGMTASKTRLQAGDTTTLALAATDADGDTLAYAWTSSCEGTFSAPGAATTDFTLTTLPPGSTCTMTSTVTDGRGGSNTGTLTLNAGAGPTLTIAGAATTAYHYVSSSNGPSGVFSFNGSAWTPMSATPPVDLQGAAYIGELGGKMYERAQSGPIVSFDGSTWSVVGSAAPSNLAPDSYLGALGGKAYHVALDVNGNRVVESFDGATWSDLSTNVPNAYFSQQTFLGVIGSKAYHFVWNDTTSALEVDAFDGTTWSTLPTVPPYYGFSAQSSLGVIGNTAYQWVPDENGTFHLFAFDGAAFSELPASAPSGNTGGSSFIGVVGGKAYHWVADYQTGNHRLYAFDGTTWTSQPSNTPPSVGGFTMGESQGSYLGAL